MSLPVLRTQTRGEGLSHFPAMSPDLVQIDASIQQLLGQLNQEGLLDDQFSQLRQLQDEGNPDFVQEVVELYFEDSTSKLEKLSAKLQDDNPDYSAIDQLVHQFKGSSASFGAQAVAQACSKFRELCQQEDRSSCQALLQHISASFQTLKSRLDVFLQLEAQRKQLGAYS